MLKKSKIIRTLILLLACFNCFCLSTQAASTQSEDKQDFDKFLYKEIHDSVFKAMSHPQVSGDLWKSIFTKRYPIGYIHPTQIKRQDPSVRPYVLIMDENLDKKWLLWAVETALPTAGDPHLDQNINQYIQQMDTFIRRDSDYQISKRQSNRKVLLDGPGGISVPAYQMTLEDEIVRGNYTPMVLTVHHYPGQRLVFLVIQIHERDWSKQIDDPMHDFSKLYDELSIEMGRIIYTTGVAQTRL